MADMRRMCRNMGECQAAVAEAVELFGGLDILLCCTSEGIYLDSMTLEKLISLNEAVLLTRLIEYL